MRKLWWVWNLRRPLIPRSTGRGDAAAAAAGGNNSSRSCNTWISRCPTERAGRGVSSARMVDLRSDAMTLPGPGMRRAMAEAECGDDVLKEDPVVNGGEYFTLEFKKNQLCLKIALFQIIKLFLKWMRQKRQALFFDRKNDFLLHFRI